MAPPKRPASSSTLSHPHPSSKKPRFDARNPSTLAPDAPEEDLILDADVIGKSGPQLKRNAVNIDGYDSDSENDNFNERAAERERSQRKNGAAGSKDEEEDDMFADLEEADGDEDEDVAAAGKKSKKDVRFLNPGEVDGEVLGSTSGGHVSAEVLRGREGKKRQKELAEESESSSGEEEDRDQLPEEMEDELAAEIGAGGKKKHAPRLDAFNLREEEEEGRYDEAGNFVRKAMDPDAMNDSWLDGLTRKDMKRAREAQEKRDEELRRKAVEDDALLTSDLLSTLISHLETGETALEALQRLNKGKPAAKETKVPKWKQKKAKKQDDNMEVESTPSGDIPVNPAESARRSAVDAITGAADAIYGRDQHEIYDTEREVLLRQFRRETGEDWRPTAPAAEGGGGEWEFRWSEGGDLHGPYDEATMRAWREAGYFAEGVDFRRVGGRGEWSRVLDLRQPARPSVSQIATLRKSVQP